ncbi:MAG TPA: hypothetical protein DER60_00840 [Syntrophomonas sp.]|jgi:hypothetical protein|nr:hypothetical protein [Syntrophomonas sp.]
MRKTLILAMAVLLIALSVVPAAAEPGFVLKLNGQDYNGPFTVYDGSTAVPLTFIEEALPVETTVENETITIGLDDATLVMKLGSKAAVLNGQEKAMPLAPQLVDQDTMVPLRFVLESFGAQVGWDAGKNEISVTTPVLKAGLTAEQMLGKITQAMTSEGRYKMKADTTMQMEMTADGQTQNVDMSGQVNASVQEKPLLGYVSTSMKVDNITGTDEAVPPEALVSEVVLNDEGMFMTMPGYEGWVKMEMEGLDLNRLMEQYGSQDPVQSVLQMKEFGAVVNYEADKVVEGKNYGVIHVAMSEEALGKYLNSVIEQTGLFKASDAEANDTELQAILDQVLKNFKADMSYDMVFDYETYLMVSMDMDMDMNMTLDIPANEESGTPATSMQIKSKQQAVYQIYDYGVEFEVPDVSGAKTMAEVMAAMTAE